MDTSILLITHNLGVVWNMCDTVMVLYAGKTVEYADTKTLYAKPLHPYNWGLLDSIPKLSDLSLIHICLWSWVGASGQMWVEMMTSPFKMSPLACISDSFKPAATAARAPSPSETKPVRDGRAPIPPSLPIIPSGGPEPPFVFPSEPVIRIWMQSVSPSSPVTVLSLIHI